MIRDGVAYLIGLACMTGLLVASCQAHEKEQKAYREQNRQWAEAHRTDMIVQQHEEEGGDQ